MKWKIISWITVGYAADEQSVDLIKQKRMRADDFIMIKCIGRGAFGEVQLVSSYTLWLLLCNCLLLVLAMETVPFRASIQGTAVLLLSESGGGWVGSVLCVSFTIGLKCPSVCPYVCAYVRPSTKSFFDFNEIWHLGRGRWAMDDGMHYDPIQG